MKKIAICILAMVLSFTFNPSTLSAQAPVSTEQTHQSDEAKKISSRLDEIKKLDPSKMSRLEKHKIRRELKAMQKKNDIGGGVYISAGALIVILILLIIFL